MLYSGRRRPRRRAGPTTDRKAGRGESYWTEVPDAAGAEAAGAGGGDVLSICKFYVLVPPRVVRGKAPVESAQVLIIIEI